GGLADLHPDLPEGWARVDGRLALPAGQRRGEPDRARVRIPGDRATAHRAQGHEARVAADRDSDALDHDRLRRGPQQGDGQRGARERRLPRAAEAGAADALRSVLAQLDGRRLPRVAGGGRAQGRALHDPEVDLRQEIVGARSARPRPARPRLGAARARAGRWLDGATTRTDLKALGAAVGGDRVRVESLAPALHEPHAVDVKPGQLARLKSAAFLVRVGLDHEPWLARV